ncbi:MAG: bacteriohemerythrin [Rhodocyclaceae bacterium]|nr:bacteriohemerythrin [Rhodocyclaceae bacterium]
MDQRPRFDAKYHVGIEQVDTEHRQLFEIAGRVYDALGEKGAAADGIARAAIAELLDYTTTHFANEEALMEAAAYPELAAHRELHHHLLSRARDMEMRVEFDAQFVPLELNRFIASWLVEHIQDSDRKFGDFVANKRPPPFAPLAGGT